MEPPAEAPAAREAAAGAFRPAVLIPTFNNARTVGDVVERTLQVHPEVLVVDDGSTDSTPQVLARLQGRVRLHRLPRNCGKGRALREGFRLLASEGFTHAVSVDADGQHFPEDIPGLIDAARAVPGAIVVGERSGLRELAPRRSRFGLWFSNAALASLGRARLRDSQCGFRVYPLAVVGALDLRGDRYDLELEVLIQAARRGVELCAAPVRVTYSPPGGRVSHFRPVRDFLQIAGRVSRILSRRAH